MIGGQACIVYGAAEFSRDSDFMILCSDKNLQHLQKALHHLKAELIYVPPLKMEYLERGHSCHFRCTAKEVKGLRIDVLSKLKGCESFDKLWERKKRVTLKGRGTIDVIGLQDLVQSKKTQRDKDWLMLKRLVENDIILNKDEPSDDHVSWWLLEARSPEHLIELARKYPKITKDSIIYRPLLTYALTSDIQRLNSELHQEELIERQKDIEYWAPLRKELELLRHKKQ
ncbi:MAG: hypothetical protein ISS45_05420 [Candidatus Omnitrophica bacterium]|nr:hypothetical protein [Candidatus Omnitrophota bacterium]